MGLAKHSSALMDDDNENENLKNHCYVKLFKIKEM